ncbi:hypothetical protein ABVC73_04710 [Prevotella melaninogenica]
MAIFKAVVRRPRKDGFWQVYIRVGVGVKAQVQHRTAIPSAGVA